MIEEIRVRGMGGIRTAELSFSGDFIVITGESGSGKSSLARAFEFISGRRTQAASIHADCDEVVVEALWNEAAAHASGAEGGELLTTRSLSRSGKGRCRINGELATLGQLSSLSAALIDIQSQFAQLRLLDPARQLEIVDSCGDPELKDAKSRLVAIFPAVLTLEKEIISLKKRARDLETELEGVEKRIKLIRALAPTPGCEKEWGDELARLEKQAEEAARYEEFVRRLDGGESDAGILDRLSSIVRELYSIAPESVGPEWHDLGESALTSLQQLFDSARSELSSFTGEELEKRRDIAERRIGILRKLLRETGVRRAEDLLSYADEAEADMRWMKESGGLIAEKQAIATRLRAEAGSLARTLRARREEAALSFERRVRTHLRDLAMENVAFSAQIQRLDRVRAQGAETVSFTLALKDGLANPVAKVASGGELSRILIAIQASLDPSRLPGVLVFDEVEAGLGGRTALLAGRKLKTFSLACRTILITHEATIAAMADQHFVVRRDGDETVVREVAGEDREREIARMLAGSQSREAMVHARALLESHGSRGATA